MTSRIERQQVLDLIEPWTGPIASAYRIDEGLNSQVALVVNGRYFVKGLRQDHPWVRTQNREKEINPFVRHVSAELEWSVESDTWNLLGFRYVVGRRADYAVGSPDIALIAKMIARIPEAPTDLDLKLAEQRWSAYSEQPELFSGDHLSHTDWSPGNVLISEDARLVDWAWPTRGGDWIDPACWIVWLIACGHTPAQAERQAVLVPSFALAPEEAVTAFSAAQAAMWADIGDSAPHAGLASAAADWHKYRSNH